MSRFKKDEYIVILKCKNSTFSENFIFKQREEHEYLRPYFDCYNHQGNGIAIITRNTNLDRWRYADAEEIAEYERLGKPYEVTLWKESPTADALIIEAANRFPEGSKVREQRHPEIFTIASLPYWNDNDQKQIVIEALDGGIVELYNKGIWSLPIIEGPPAKFKIGDIVDTNTTGYQYTNMRTFHHYKWEVIVTYNVKTHKLHNKKVLDLQYSPTHQIWWYLVEGYANWITENCMTKALTTDEILAEAKKRFPEGSYVISKDGGFNGIVCWSRIKNYKRQSPVFRNETNLFVGDDRNGGETMISLYYDGIWATLNDPLTLKQQLIDEARLRYPTGCIVNTLSAVGKRALINWNEMSKYKFESPYFTGKGELYLGCDQEKGNIRALVYDGQKWANQFSPVKEDSDYIVSKLNPNIDLLNNTGISVTNRRYIKIQSRKEQRRQTTLSVHQQQPLSQKCKPKTK